VNGRRRRLDRFVEEAAVRERGEVSRDVVRARNVRRFGAAHRAERADGGRFVRRGASADEAGNRDGGDDADNRDDDEQLDEREALLISLHYGVSFEARGPTNFCRVQADLMSGDVTWSNSSAI